MTVTFRDKVRGPASSFGYGAPLFGASDIRVDQTYTNPDTGLSWSGRLNQLQKDQRLLSVDGNLLTYRVGVVVHFQLFAADGSLDRRTDGRFEFTILIDTKGTATPDDDTDSFLEQTKESGHITNSDFCDDAIKFTVPVG